MSLDDKRKREGDDLPPSGDEARAQRKATSMPLVWFIVGLMLIAAFYLFASRGGGFLHRAPTGPAPVKSAEAARVSFQA